MSVAAENKDVVRRYFDAVDRGDMETVQALLDEEVSFWVPPSLPDGGEFRGKREVLALFAESFALYDAAAGLKVAISHLTAEEDRVAAELTIRGRCGSSSGGAAYENHYHFLFRIRDGRVVEIREHLDSLYAYRTLFVPAGIAERKDCAWARD